MSATDYNYDERDLMFLLFEQMQIQGLTKLEKFADFGKEDFEMICSEAVKFSKEVIGPTSKEGDEIGVKLVDGDVKVPECFKPLYNAYCESGWLAASGDPEYGGQGLPYVMTSALADVFTGANVSFFLYGLLGVGVAHIMEKYDIPEWLRDLVIPKLYDGSWAGTMVLTEPGAGSDVGNAKTKAEKIDGEDMYLISGQKIFITGGDHDMAENIMHLVLARTPGAPAGTKGLSLFLVPKFNFDKEGNLSDRNDVNVVGIEHKMGIHASATCQLSFGDEGKCKGWLVGNEGDGIMVMFNMMNEARIEVGLQGCSCANAAYLNALSYSRDRIQGSSIKEFKNPAAPRVAIIEHPDVRRQLMTMKAFGEGLRSLMLYAAYCADLGHHSESAEDREKYMGIFQLLTPICKAYSTDRGVDMTSMAIQVFGGYGYTQDYPVERHMRDVKIGCIYEGTNSIQSLDLMARKLPMKKGAIFMSYLADLDKIAEEASTRPCLTELVPIFKKAKDIMAEVAMTLGGWGMQGRLDLATSRAVQFLDLMGDVVIASELLKRGITASKALEVRMKDAGINPAEDTAAFEAHLKESDESSFYHGKIMAATFFVRNILPRGEGWAKAIKDEDLSHMIYNF